MSKHGGYEGHENSEHRQEVSRGVIREVFLPEKQEIQEMRHSAADFQGLMEAAERDSAIWKEIKPGADNAIWKEIRPCAEIAWVCQEAAARSLMGDAFSEEKLRLSAMRCVVTGKKEIGALLEEMGLDVTRETGCGLRDIGHVLGEGGKVIVKVSGPALRFAEYAKRPGVQADCVVQVLGIDVQDSGQVQVMIQDTQAGGGQMRGLSQQHFESAWAVGDCAMISVYR